MCGGKIRGKLLGRDKVKSFSHLYANQLVYTALQPIVGDDGRITFNNLKIFGFLPSGKQNEEKGRENKEKVEAIVAAH